MNCRDFRSKHDAYIDDTLSGVELEGMASHLHFCEACAHRDTRVRRALMLARNIPLIEPSAGFAAKLQARLNDERSPRLIRPAPVAYVTFTPATYTMIAAGVLLAAGLVGASALASHPAPSVVRLAPVVASRAEAAPIEVAPTMVAAMPAGMPVWPAVFVAQQASVHFASDEASR